jgi:phosphatidylglycerophosphate synthase/choline kinase
MIKKALLLVNTSEMIENLPVALANISGVALLKRIVLDLRRAEVSRIVVVLDKPHEAIERLLARQEIGIRPIYTTDDDWRERALEGRGEDALLLDANRLYDFRTLAALAATRLGDLKALISIDLNDSDATREPERRFTVYDGKPLEISFVETQNLPANRVGAYALKHQLLEEFIALPSAQRYESARQLVARDEAAFFDVGNGFVQPISSPTDLRVAEKRILRYVWKETDGIHAHANKRLALPIIKLLLKTPITPNMISVAGVFVSIAAGYFFSRGSYSYFVLGAAISYLSALFDHFDGSVARLKNMESAFGAYFEQACDFAYYFSFAIGVTVGLYRETNNQTYIFLGAALIFGAMAGLMTISYQRKVFASNPSQLGAQAQRKLEDNKQNPIYRFGRNTYFFAKRPVMPYYVFFFAVLDMLPFILFMAALGANLFWSIQIYSNRLFRQRAERIET